MQRLENVYSAMCPRKQNNSGEKKHCYLFVCLFSFNFASLVFVFILIFVFRALLANKISLSNTCHYLFVNRSPDPEVRERRSSSTVEFMLVSGLPRQPVCT